MRFFVRTPKSPEVHEIEAPTWMVALRETLERLNLGLESGTHCDIRGSGEVYVSVPALHGGPIVISPEDAKGSSDESEDTSAPRPARAKPEQASRSASSSGVRTEGDAYDVHSRVTPTETVPLQNDEDTLDVSPQKREALVQMLRDATSAELEKLDTEQAQSLLRDDGAHDFSRAPTDPALSASGTELSAASYARHDTEDDVPVLPKASEAVASVDSGESERMVGLEHVLDQLARRHDEKLRLAELGDLALQTASELIDFESGAVLIPTLSGRELIFLSASGPKAHEVRNLRVPVASGIAGFCVREGISLSLRNAADDERFYPEIGEMVDYTPRAMMCAPLRVEDNVYGVVQLMSNADSRMFTPREVGVVTYIASHFARYIHSVL